MSKTNRNEPYKVRSPIGRPGVRFTDRKKERNRERHTIPEGSFCEWCYEDLMECVCDDGTLDSDETPYR